MLTEKDLQRYKDVPWDQYFYLDDTSPTGLRWKTTLKNSRTNPGDVAGSVVLKCTNRNKPYNYVSVTLKGTHYSVIVILQLLKGEHVATVGEQIPFTERNSAWLTANVDNVWWTIHRHLRLSSNRAQARASRVIDRTDTYDEDFLQDVFSDTCLTFNRNYTPDKGEETTHIWWCAKGAISKAFRARYSYASRTLNDTNEHENAIAEAITPDHVAGLIEVEKVSTIQSHVRATVDRLFKCAAECSDRRFRTSPSSKARAVFDLHMKGMRDKEIAKELKISRQRVAQYQQWYMRKLKQLYKGREELLYS